MSRQHFLDLAARRLRMPIGADLVLRQQPDSEEILLDGEKLGRVVERAAREFGTPLAFPVMDLKLEKATVLSFFGVPAAEVDSFHFQEAPSVSAVARYAEQLAASAPTPRIAANLGALRYIAEKTDLLPVGMSIGPFSLTTKLLSDPITPVFLAGSGATAAEDPEVALVEAALQISLTMVLHSVSAQLAAGAKAVFIAEPAANKVFFSPKQLEDGADVFERYAIRPNQAVAALVARHGADLVFHCCGELVDTMLDRFCSLRPCLLSLGSSRKLWEDAQRVPKDIVLYGNLPSKQFYSDQIMPLSRIDTLVAELESKMAATGHPFILGTECDTLHVEGSGATIRSKVLRMIQAGRA